MPSKICSHEVERACSRAAEPIRESKPGWVSRSSVKVTKSSKVFAMYPVLPCCTVYFGPPTAVTTAGTPEESASSTARPNVSVSDGNTKRSILANARDKFFPVSTPREFRVLHVVSQPGCLCTLPNHNHPEIPMAAGEERLLKLREAAHVLFSRESSHVADGEGTAVAVPELRTENRSIYAMGHQKTGLAGRSLEPLDHFLVWREQQSRDPVKTCCGAKAPVFNRAQQSGGRGLGQE